MGVPPALAERGREREREREKDIRADPRLTADSERRCSARNAQTSRPVNRSTHYHKCPRRARPTRKSVSQIARVGLCHLSRPGLPPPRAPPLRAPPRSPRFAPERSGAMHAIESLLSRCPSSYATRTRSFVATFPGTLVNNAPPISRDDEALMLLENALTARLSRRAL